MGILLIKAEFHYSPGEYNCNSKFVIYRLIYKTRDKQYIGSTQTAFRLRFNNYKSHVWSLCERENKVLFLRQVYFLILIYT